MNPGPKPKALYEIDDEGRLELNLHEGQTRAWDSTRRFTFVFAGTQSGKTSFGPWWLWDRIKRSADPKGGDNDYIAASATFDLFKLKMLPEMKKVFENILGIARYWSGDRVFELRDPVKGYWARKADDIMWGRIILRSAESKGGLESSSGRAMWLDECGQDSYTLETWEAAQSRVALYQGDVLGTTTLYNLGWTKNAIYDRWVAGDKKIAVINFPSYANPSFNKEEYDHAKATMAPHKFKMRYDGEFDKPPGMIYDCFDDTPFSGHVVAPFEIPSSWPRYTGADFGGVNTALVWVAHDQEKDVYYLYSESLEGSKTTKGHVAGALKKAEGVNVVQWAGGAPSEDQYRRDWEDAGIPMRRPPVDGVENQIDRVYELFQTFRLKVFSTCTGVLDEIGTYKRELDDSGEPTEKIADKRKFHRLDALRYICTILGVKQDRFRPFERKKR